MELQGLRRNESMNPWNFFKLTAIKYIRVKMDIEMDDLSNMVEVCLYIQKIANE